MAPTRKTRTPAKPAPWTPVLGGAVLARGYVLAIEDEKVHVQFFNGNDAWIDARDLEQFCL